MPETHPTSDPTSPNISAEGEEPEPIPDEVAWALFEFLSDLPAESAAELLGLR